MSVRVNLEIGHEASIRTKTTPEGFTHDWEVYVRGCDGAEIHYFVDKVVFHLHETFSKPRRVIKEPPYAVKESGYAGFTFPIEIYLRNKDEPKKVRFNYDLQLPSSGPSLIKVQKEKYVFSSPSDEFKHKLLKGGGTVVPSNAQDNSESNRSSSEPKNELINKPKLGGFDPAKKHKIKVDEPRISNSFQELFGTPITTKMTTKVFAESKPISKDVNKNTGGKSEKDKDKNKEKSKYSPVKEKDKSKESDRKKDEKRSKDRSREREHSKEKRKSPKPNSPLPKRSPKRISSPKRPPSPTPVKHKEKDEKRIDSNKDKERKDEKKTKKRDKEHKENKHKDKELQKHLVELKKEQKPARDKELSPASLIKAERKEKIKDSPKDTPEVLPEKKPDKIEEKPKHKHKKKDKDRKDKEKDKSHREKAKDKAIKFPPDVGKEIRDDKSNLFSSPKSEDKPKKILNTLFSEGEIDSSNSSPSSRDDLFVESTTKESLFEAKKPPPDKPKPKREKTKKSKEKKSEKEEKKRKRKSDKAEDEPVEKILKEDVKIVLSSSDSEQNSNMSQAVEVDKENQENAEDYMQILRDLQHKIMTLQDNSELQKVVQLIAETGRYEVSARTFDFDLCLLDKSTVRQLQEFFASS